ncbi:hypothetical protein GCM10009810_07320 [Nostocoides vanveenii]|uniref:Transposase n=1 Tax=Nostocoides vanveenii TaxID=330835 RepID=A0ABN2K6L3_9MICO
MITIEADRGEHGWFSLSGRIKQHNIVLVACQIRDGRRPVRHLSHLPRPAEPEPVEHVGAAKG